MPVRRGSCDTKAVFKTTATRALTSPLSVAIQSIGAYLGSPVKGFYPVLNGEIGGPLQAGAVVA